MKKQILFLFSIIIFLSSSISYGENRASFDCKKASTPTEKLICDNWRLSSDDRLLTSTYLKRLMFLSEEEKKFLKTEQISWLKRRDKYCQQAQDTKSYIDEMDKLLKVCEPTKVRKQSQDAKSNINITNKDCMKKICLKKMYEERTKELELKIPGLSRFDRKPTKDLEQTILESKEFFALPEYYYRLSDYEYLFPIDEQGGRQQLGLYYADSKTNKMNKIISWYPSIEGVIQGKGITWLIVYYTDLNHGFSSNGYKAVMIKNNNSSKKPYQLFDLASIDSPYIEEDYGEANPCAYISDSQKKIDNSFSELKGYNVKDLNGDGINDMVFRIERFDCKNNKHYSINETYYFLSNDPYIEKREQKTNK